MMFLFKTLILVGIVLAQSDLLVDRQCPCTLNKLWLDVVVLIDSSTFMGMNKLIQVISDVGSVFIQSEISPEDGQFTKVGVITYDSSANVRFNMTYFDSTDTFEQEIWNLVPDDIIDYQSNIYDGLQAASNLLDTTAMPNRRQLILIYAATYQIKVQDPAAIANQLKKNGVSIIVVSFTPDTQNNENLQSIASPNMFIKNTNLDIIGTIQQELCQINCYCPSGWTQFADSFSDFQKRYGECLEFGFYDDTWNIAESSCQAGEGQSGYLATVFNNSKMDYLMTLARAQSSFPAPHNFFIGLWNQNGVWLWEQGKKNGPLTADSNTPWAPGYPKDNNLGCGEVFVTDATEQTFGIRNVVCSLPQRFVCQINTCDTDNYCQ